jgi:NADH-quinone oxidoreductase subunit E
MGSTTGKALAAERIADQEAIDRVIAAHGNRPGALLGILERIQEQHRQKYLPLDALAYVAARTRIPEARVYAVATFYSLFNLVPQGLHTITICRGTACHTRGSRTLLERLKLEMGILEAPDEVGSADKVSYTTPDGRFTVRTVACFGQCALAPVAEVDHAIRGHVNERALLRDVEALRKDRDR